MIAILEQEEDINQVTAYFSYEHFYVIYCKFWELDRDHDLFIDKMDLTRHNDHGEKIYFAIEYNAYQYILLQMNFYQIIY